MEDQAKHIYKKVELGNKINVATIKQEIDQDQELDRLDDSSGDINPYRELVVNNPEKVDTILTQMKQWSILSNVVNYIQYDRHSKSFYNLDRERRETKVRVRFWRHARGIKRRIFRYI